MKFLKMFRIDDERLLLQKLKEGSKEAFHELYLEYFQKLCSYISFFTKNSDHSQDIVQQVMMKIWDKHSEINIGNSLKHYLFRASYNEFINVNKRAKKFSLLEELTLEAYEEIQDDAPYYLQHLELVKREIEKLPPKCKEVFILNKMEGKRYREIAQQLGISEKTVEIHISNAMKKIRTVVNPPKS